MKEWEIVKHPSVVRTCFQCYLKNGELENAKEILEKGYEPKELIGDLFHIISFRREDSLIPSFELLLDYGYPFSELEEKIQKRLLHANELNVSQWRWLLQRGFDANWEIRKKPLLFHILSEIILDKEEEKSELVFWLLASGAKVKNEYGETVFESLKKRKLYFLVPVLDIFLDTFDEESIKEYKAFRLQSLFGRGK